MKKKIKATKKVKQTIKGIIRQQLTWVPSMSEEVASQQVVISEDGKKLSPVNVPAGEGEVVLSLKEGSSYRITIYSDTAEGQRSSSIELSFVAGSGIPMPATDLAIVTAPVEVKAGDKKSFPDFPNEQKSKTVKGSTGIGAPEELSLDEGLQALEEYAGKEEDVPPAKRNTI